MIKEGSQSRATYWGNYTVKKVVKLDKQVECFSKEKGKCLFNPTLVKLEWENPPSEDKHEFWFPYWITIGDNKEKYGQFAPMIGEKALLELLGKAISANFFSHDFLVNLHQKIEDKNVSEININD
jgi:hypothetical protein